MDYPGGSNLITHVLRSKELFLARVRSEDVRDVTKAEGREIPSAGRVQCALTVSEVLGPIYKDWREALEAKGILQLTTSKEMGTSALPPQGT